MLVFFCHFSWLSWSFLLTVQSWGSKWNLDHYKNRQAWGSHREDFPRRDALLRHWACLRSIRPPCLPQSWFHQSNRDVWRWVTGWELQEGRLLLNLVQGRIPKDSRLTTWHEAVIQCSSHCGCKTIMCRLSWAQGSFHLATQPFEHCRQVGLQCQCPRLCTIELGFTGGEDQTQGSAHARQALQQLTTPPAESG